MPSFCCVVNCGSRGIRDNISFFKIPKITNFKHKTRLNELSVIRRQKWIAAIGRADLTDCKLKFAQVCAKHFITGKPSNIKDENNLDWVPSQNMGYEQGLVPQQKSKRYRKRLKMQPSSTVTDPSTSTEVTTDLADQSVNVETSTKEVGVKELQLQLLLRSTLKQQTETSAEKKTIYILGEVKKESGTVESVVEIKEEDELQATPEVNPERPLEVTELKEQKETSLEKKKIYILGEVKTELGDLESVFEVKEEPVEEPELGAIMEVDPERPLGDDILRVCRTCLGIMKIEDTVPLLDKSKLYKRLSSILQFDLLTIKNPCLCKSCERFINAVHEFRATCKVNEGTLREFHWENKTKDLLHVVDQNDLRAMYDEITGIPHSSTTTVENKSSPIDSDVCDEIGKELDEKGNSLSDLGDHRCNEDKRKKIDHDYAENTSSLNPTSNSLPTEKSDIFSPVFDDYFEMLDDQASVHVKAKFWKNYNKTEGKGPFLCECCGKMIGSRMSYNRHKKLHHSTNRFRCEECHEDFHEWASYNAHYKSVHKNLPRSSKCDPCPDRHRYKKMLDLYLKIHDVEKSNYTCVDCGRVFKEKVNFEKHRALHRASEILCKFCGLRFRRTALNRHIQSKHAKGKSEDAKRSTFKCNLCERCYFREGSLSLHVKLCHNRENLLPSTNTAKETLVDGVGNNDALENYEIVADKPRGNAKIVILENLVHFSNIKTDNLVLMQED